MKSLKTSIGLLGASLLAFGMASVYQPRAGSFIASPLVRGTNIIFYVGTADTATTFDEGDTYTTNRTYSFGGSTVTPKSTNAVTGALQPTFSVAAPVPTLASGAKSDNLAISVKFSRGTGSPSYTNTTTTLYFIRSSDGGATYDKSGLGFTFVVDAVNNTGGYLVTNLDSSFIQGASHIKLWKVVTGANPPDDAQFRILSCYLSGVSP